MILYVTVKSKKKTKNNGITIIACHIGNEVSAPLNKVVIPFNIAYQAIGTLRGFLNPTIQYNFKGELRENQRMDFDIILEKIQRVWLVFIPGVSWLWQDLSDDVFHRALQGESYHIGADDAAHACRCTTSSNEFLRMMCRFLDLIM